MSFARGRFAFFIAMGIFVPAMFLGALTIRLFRYENQVLRYQADTQIRAEGESLREQISDKITQPLDLLKTVAAGPSFTDWNPTGIESRLKTLKALGPIPVRSVYALTMEGKLAYGSSHDNFRKRQWPLLHEVIRRRHWSDEGGIVVSPDRASGLWWLVAPVSSALPMHRVGWLVASIPSDAVTADYTHELASWKTSTGLQVSMGEMGPGNNRREPFVSEVNVLDPPLHLIIGSSPNSQARQQARHRFRLASAIVSLSVLMIVCGALLLAMIGRREAELSALKADFVSHVSHELRTPLTAVRYAVDRLKEGRYRDAQDQQRLLQTLAEETDRLQEMTDQVLDFSKVLSRETSFHLEPLPLAALTKEAVERMHPLAELRRVELQVSIREPDVQIQVDKKSALHAVTNLIDNAIKYGGSRVRVTTGLEGRNAMIQVSDSGGGISTEEQPRIFEKFYRGSGHHDAPGSGLGLAMVKTIMARHGGRVSLTSAAGQGSVFTLYFPISRGDSS